MSFLSALLRSKPIRLDMYGSRESRAGTESTTVDDTFHHIYVPLLKLATQFSAVKYIVLLVYCIRSMQEHLSTPTYCKDPRNTFSCSSSSCFWLHKIVLNLPHFMVNGGLFVEQCAYLLVVFFISCTLFMYAIYLIRRESELKLRYRAVLILPSLFFELAIGFLSYYSTIISIVAYSRTASSNPDYFSSAFIIFAFIISIFYALLIVIHFAAAYYIMIFPIPPLSIYAISNANYSELKYGRTTVGRSGNYEKLPSMPLINDMYGASMSSYSKIRSWNNTIRSTNTIRNRETIRTEDHDYLELV